MRCSSRGRARRSRSGDRVVYGDKGEVVGPATLEPHKGKGLAVQFPGNKDAICCLFTQLTQLMAAKLLADAAAELMATELLAAEDASKQMRHDQAKRRLNKNRKKRERRRPASQAQAETQRAAEVERERQQIVHDGQKFEYAEWC